MKNWTWLTVTFALSAWIAAPIVLAETVLYPHPESAGEAITTVPEGDARLQIRGPVVDSAAAEAGWHWGELDDTFEGYVTVAKISKDLYPVPGTMVHLLPDIDSPILTSITDDDLDSGKVEILAEGDWWHIRVHKSIPVFFQVASAPEEGPDPKDTAPEEVEDAGEVVALFEEEAAEHPAENEPPEAVDPPAPVRFESFRPLASAEESAHGSTVRGSLGSTFRGTLQPTGRRFLIAAHPFPYELRDRNNRRVAYVDLSDAVLRYPMNHYLDHTVSLFGTWESIEGSRDIVIHVRNITILSTKD